jgi:hypothetical protein
MFDESLWACIQISPGSQGLEMHVVQCFQVHRIPLRRGCISTGVSGCVGRLYAGGPGIFFAKSLSPGRARRRLVAIRFNLCPALGGRALCPNMVEYVVSEVIAMGRLAVLFFGVAYALSSGPALCEVAVIIDLVVAFMFLYACFGRRACRPRPGIWEPRSYGPSLYSVKTFPLGWRSGHIDPAESRQ